MNGPEPGRPRFPGNLLTDCFPLGQFDPTAQGPRPRVGDPDESRLEHAARLCEAGDPRQAHAEVLDVLPYATADRRRLVMAHLIRAQAAYLSGDRREASEGCVAAHQLADLPKMGELRVPVLCLLARVTADSWSAATHARRAVTLARRRPWTFHAHATLAALLVESLPYEAVEQVRLARAEAPPEADGLLAALESVAFDRLRSPPSRDLVLDPVRAEVFLTEPPRLVMGSRTYPMADTPLLALLVAYLVEHPEARLVDIAERLLPEGRGESAKVRHSDEAHRVARIRQVVQRLRRLVGDPDVIVAGNGRLRLGPGYHWASDLAAVRRTHSLLARSVAARAGVSWLDDLFG